MNMLFGRSRIALGLAAALGFAVMVGEASAAPVVTSGSDPSATLTGAVRYRNFGSSGGKEVRVGAAGLATPAEGDATWGSSKCVQFSYDGAGSLTAKIAAAATPCSFASPSLTVTKSSLSLGSLNYLEITITKNTPTTSVALNGVTLGADALGNFSVSGGGATVKWKVTGIDLTAGFTLTGTLALTGLSGSGDSSYVEIDVGYVVPPDAQGPITSSVVVSPQPVLLNGEGKVTAVVDDSTTGGHNIASAEYSLNGAAYAAMTAQDGAFDEVAEDVQATFTATQLGLNDVCVRGADVLGNVGAATCQAFLVTYKFTGFFSPIENDYLNVAKAGQAVPAKWRLTDANDVPISDPASFTGLYSYPIDCTDFQGDPLDSIEEVAAGSSGLQYDGDGYWQFNWKTPKTYANTCRAMYVEFNSGATSPVVKFKFKLK